MVKKTRQSKNMNGNGTNICGDRRSALQWPIIPNFGGHSWQPNFLKGRVHSLGNKIPVIKILKNIIL